MKRLMSIVGVAMGAALIAGAAGAQEVTLSAKLTGAAETPPGDPDGSGTASVKVDPATAQVCYEIKVAGIGQATAAHIHKGAAGAGGPPVVPLAAPSTGSSSSCAPASSKELAADLIANPRNYYVNIHNQEFPPGALRGQLAK
jgi:hypothetical protein